MASRVLSIELTGTNAKAIAAIEGVGAAASKTGTAVESKMGGAASKVGGAFSKLDQQLGNFGLPFAGALGALGGKLEQTEGKTKTFGGTLSSIGGASILAAGAGLAVVGGSAVKMAQSFDVAHTQLQVAVKNVGESFSAYSSGISATDDKLTKLGFTGTDTETSLAKLTTATKSVGFAESLMGLAADLARARHLDLASATNILVKVETGHVALLGRLGINTKDAAGHTIDATTAIQRLTTLYGGQAAAYTTTFSGKLAVLSATADKLGVGLGNILIPKIEGAASAAVAGVSGFESFNSSLDGVPGKVLAVGAAVPAAVYAFDKLSTVGGKVVDAFSRLGQGAGNAISGIGNLVGAGGAVTAEEDLQATALQTAGAAATGKGVALAALGVAQDKEAAASLAVTEANNTLAASLYDVGAADTEIVAAANAAAAAQSRLAAASNATATAEANLAVAETGAGAAGEEAGVGMAAALGPIGLVVAGVGALGIVLDKVFVDNNRINAIGADATAMQGLGDAATKAKESIAGLLAEGPGLSSDTTLNIGTQAAQDVQKYSDELTANAGVKVLNATKTASTVDIERQLAAQYVGSATAAKLSADQLDLLRQRNTYYGQAVNQTVGNMRVATDALDALTKKYGIAGVQTLQLTAAQKTYADDLASGHASDTTLANDKATVIALSTKQATTQNAVNAATQAGTDIANHSGVATTAQAAAIKAADAAQKALTSSLDKYGAEAGPSLEKAVTAMGLGKAAVDELTATTKSLNTAIDTAFGDATKTTITNWSSVADFSLQKFEADLLSNVLAVASWGRNIDLLVANHINVGFLHAIEDAGIKAAPLVQHIVDTIGQGSITSINSIEALATSADAGTTQTVDNVVAMANAVPGAIASSANAAGSAVDGTVARVKAAYVGLVGYINSLQGVATFGANVVPMIGGQPATSGQFAALAIDLHNPGAGLPFAKGGPVNKAVPVVVGEQGPEVFEPKAGGKPVVIGAKGPQLWVPPSAGTIIPNDALAAGVPIKTYAQGGPVGQGLPPTPFGSYGTHDVTSLTFTAGSSSTSAFTGGTTSLQSLLGTFSSTYVADLTKVNQSLAAAKAAELGVEALHGRLQKAATVVTNADNALATLNQLVANATNLFKFDLATGSPNAPQDLKALGAVEAFQAQAAKGDQIAKAQYAAVANTYRQAQNLASNDAKIAADAQRAFAQASNASLFTNSITASTALLAKFENELQTLANAGDKNLAHVLATAGPDQAQPLAAAFASNLPKAAAAEQALDASDLQTANYQKFVGSFDQGGIVPGPLGQPVPIIAHGGEFVDNTPLHGGGSKGVINLTIINQIDPITGRSVYKVVKDDQRLNGAWDIKINTH